MGKAAAEHVPKFRAMLLGTHQLCKYCGSRKGRTYSFSCQVLRDRCNQEMVYLAKGKNVIT